MHFTFAIFALTCLVGSALGTCTPRDDCMGHYGCNDDGTVKCNDGWTGTWCTERTSDEMIDCPKSNLQKCYSEGVCFKGGCCCSPKDGFAYTKLCQEAAGDDPCAANPCEEGEECGIPDSTNAPLVHECRKTSESETTSTTSSWSESTTTSPTTTTGMLTSGSQPLTMFGFVSFLLCVLLTRTMQ